MLSPSLALLASIAGIMILLRLKLHPGLAIFTGSLIVSLLVLPLRATPVLMIQSLLNYQTLRLLVMIASALTLSRLMEEKGLLARLAATMESINPRVAVHLIPAVIGFVPMPAGALVSATASRDLSRRLGLTPEKSTFINYWFRHLWEYSIPVYPSLIATSILLAVPLSFVVTTLSPLSGMAIVFGLVLTYGMLQKELETRKTSSKSIAYNLLAAAWPILLLIPLVLLGLEAMIAFPLTLLLLVLQQRAQWPELKQALRYGLDWKIMFLLYAVMLYKAIVESSGTANALFSDMQAVGLPALVMLAVLPFLMGFATGFALASVGVAFPLLLPFISPDSGVNSYALLLAFASGMMGVMLSPLHLCLVLSAEYFKANLAKVYRYIVPPAVMIEAITVLIYLIAS